MLHHKLWISPFWTGRQCRLSSLCTWKIDNCKFNWNQFNWREEKERSTTIVRLFIDGYVCLTATLFHSSDRDLSLRYRYKYSSPFCRAVLLVQLLIERLLLVELHPKTVHTFPLHWSWPANWAWWWSVVMVQLVVIISSVVLMVLVVLHSSAQRCTTAQSKSAAAVIQSVSHHLPPWIALFIIISMALMLWHKQPSNSSNKKVIITTRKQHRHHPVIYWRVIGDGERWREVMALCCWLTALAVVGISRSLQWQYSPHRLH